MQLVKSESFGAITCDVYSRDGQFWFTREQIGEALEYAHPQKAIDNLHNRNKERMDKFSVTLKLRAADGKLYDTRVYSPKGVYEICRFCTLPKANAFYDWVYNLLEGLRTGRIAIRNTALEDYMGMSEEERAIAYFQNRITLKQLEPKAEAFDRFLSADNAQPMAVVAKSLGTGRDRLFAFLRKEGILMRDNVPYQRYVDRGYFRVIRKTINIGDREKAISQTLVTSKGQAYIAKILGRED